MYRHLRIQNEVKRLDDLSKLELKPVKEVPWNLIHKQADEHPEHKDEIVAFVKQKLLREMPKMDSTLSADVCDECGVPMMVIANDSMLACSRCAKTRVITSANAWSSSMDADFSTLHANQKSRLWEWLEMVQAKEYGDIDEGLLKAVATYLIETKQTRLEDPRILQIISSDFRKNGPQIDVPDARRRLECPIQAVLGSSWSLDAVLKQVDHVMVRNALKSISYIDARKQAERASKVSSLLSGQYPERLTSNQEEYIRKLFLTATPVQNRFRKTAQPNWPGGYPQFLRCLLILLGWDEIAAHFPTSLANRSAEREEQRKEIWALLRWEFCSSQGPLPPVTCPDGTVLTGQRLMDCDKRSKQEL